MLRAIGLLVAIFVIGMACQRLRERGTQVCGSCRLEEKAFLFCGLRFALSRDPNECSEWVLEHAMPHEHSWMRVGCWDSGWKDSLYASPALRTQDWLAYLKAQPRAVLKQTMELAEGEDGFYWGVRGAYDEWQARKRVPAGVGELGR